MRQIASVLFVLCLTACGQDAPPQPKPPTPKPEVKKEEPKGPASDPAGKYKCLKCSTNKEDYRTSDKKCPRCGEVLATEETPKPKPEHTANPGKTAVSVSYACGNEKCRWTSPNKGSGCMDCNNKCEKEVWYACAACKVEKSEPGKCEKCKADLKKTLK